MKIFDLHCDTILLCEENRKELLQNDFQVDLNKMIEGQAYTQCFAIFLDQERCNTVNKTPFERYQEIYSYFQKQIKKNKDLITIARSTKEIQKNASQNKMSAVLTVEGGEVLEGEIDKLDKIYRDGVRLLTLTWNYENCIGCSHAMGGGLKRFGFEVVEHMNELDMLVDVSHLSDEGFQNVLSITKKPIIASHSSARSLCNHSRNMTDEMLRQMGENGGVIGLNFFRKFLDPLGDFSTLDMVLQHAKRITKYAGIDALALGSDYDGIDEMIEWKDYSGMQDIVDILSKTFLPSELEKICYKNAERIFDLK